MCVSVYMFTVARCMRIRLLSSVLTSLTLFLTNNGFYKCMLHLSDSKNLFPSCSFQPVLHNWHNKYGAMPIMAWRQVCAFVFVCFFWVVFLNYHHGLNVTYILDAKQLNVSTATLDRNDWKTACP